MSYVKQQRDEQRAKLKLELASKFEYPIRNIDNCSATPSWSDRAQFRETEIQIASDP